MLRLKTVLFVLVLLVFSSCTKALFTKSADGITISVKPKDGKEAQRMRLQVYSENIIRVSATPEEKIPDTESWYYWISCENKSKSPCQNRIAILKFSVLAYPLPRVFIS